MLITHKWSQPRFLSIPVVGRARVRVLGLCVTPDSFQAEAARGVHRKNFIAASWPGFIFCLTRLFSSEGKDRSSSVWPVIAIYKFYGAINRSRLLNDTLTYNLHIAADREALYSATAELLHSTLLSKVNPD